MTTYLGKSCSFCLPRVPYVNCRQFMYLVISLLVLRGRIWDLIVSVPDHCLSFYFKTIYNISTTFQNYDPVYPHCILANSDDKEHTLSNATLPSWVPKIGNG